MVEAHLAPKNELRQMRSSISEICRKSGEQNCHICENADCGDNTNSTIAALKTKLRNLEWAIAKSVIVFGGNEAPLPELIQAVLTAKIIGGKGIETGG